MAPIHFKDIIQYKKLTSCSVCDSHEYSLPFPITKEIGPYLTALGALKYDLENISLIRIDNEYVDLQGRVGRSVLRIKFKKESKLKEVFESSLAGYLSSMMADQEIIF